MISHLSQAPQELWVCQLGHIPYRDALALQQRIAKRRQADEVPDTLLLLEHPPVYTRGRRSLDQELSLGADFYRARGIEVIDTDRGGRITYHGFGQLVGYPIMRITDIDVYLRTMEAALVAALHDEGVTARSRSTEGPDYTGVWVQERKIASIGVHVSRGVTTHGFAVNVENDLEPFSWVVACGLPDVSMTSIARELDDGSQELDTRPRALDAAPFHAAALSCFRKRVAHRFSAAHGRRQRLVSPQRLGIDAPLAAALGQVSQPIGEQPSQARAASPLPSLVASR